jgi:hypothetical protein
MLVVRRIELLVRCLFPSDVIAPRISRASAPSPPPPPLGMGVDGFTEG